MARPTAFEAAANANDDILVPPPTGLARFKESLVSCFWELEEHLADLFGLNDSKYQWAVDRYMEEKAEEEDRKNFEAYETERAIEEENEKLAEDAEKLEGRPRPPPSDSLAGGRIILPMMSDDPVGRRASSSHGYMFR